VFERFTDRARRVIVLAQDEARLLNHNYIGTEHLLLGLLREEDGVAAKALEVLGISLAAARKDVEEIIGQGQAAPTGHIPFTPRAKKILELSLREALTLGHNYIGTEHILLGLVREGEGVAAQVLQKRGADLSRVRQAVIQLLSGYVGGAETQPREGIEEMSELTFGVAEVEPPSVQVSPKDFPVCPSCLAPLAETAAVMSCPAQKEDDTVVQVELLYCSRCGSALGTIS
jgi:ATP-dependent Clp protease ATP-binding subunit ClpC